MGRVRSCPFAGTEGGTGGEAAVGLVRYPQTNFW